VKEQKNLTICHILKLSQNVTKIVIERTAKALPNWRNTKKLEQDSPIHPMPNSKQEK